MIGGLLVTILGSAPIRPRTVNVTPSLQLTVFELASPGELVQQHWLGRTGVRSDPFGTVLWPGAVFASQRLCERPERVAGRDVLCLGTGTGLEALTAAALGARRVIACDLNQLTLSLLSDAAKAADLDGVLETRVLDLMSPEPLPYAHVHIYSDVLYTEELARAIARRCRHLLLDEPGGEMAESDATAEDASKIVNTQPRWLLLTDSQGFHSKAFLETLNDDDASQSVGLNERQETEIFEWEQARLESFTGSGILTDEDVSYSTTVRCLDQLVEGR